jgi:hypothetical protein
MSNQYQPSYKNNTMPNIMPNIMPNTMPIKNTNVNLISSTYDPSRQLSAMQQSLKNMPDPKNPNQLPPTQQSYPQPSKTISIPPSSQPIPYSPYSRPQNTQINAKSMEKSIEKSYTHPSESGRLPSGLPIHPNSREGQTLRNTQTMLQNQAQQQAQQKDTLLIEKVGDKIYTHFKLKYPTTIEASGFNKATINMIITQSIKKEPLNEKSINKIIEIIDTKFKMTINSGNRQGEQYNTNAFSMDEESKISIDKYLENYTNKVTILSDNGNTSNQALEANLPKAMAPINEMIKIDNPEPFNEEFPIRDREKQTDMMKEEVREYTYYIVINSNDRNVTKFPKPNEFIIDFAPSSAAPGENAPTGYIDRTFHNIKACDLLSAVILDTSNVSGSSDYGGVSFPYLLLQFDELQTNYFGTNLHLSKAFAILTDYTKRGNYKYYSIVGDLSENTVCKVYNPRINLSKLTTRLLLPNGTPFNFGDANNNNTSNSCITFGIRLTTIQKNLSTKFLNSA